MHWYLHEELACEHFSTYMFCIVFENMLTLGGLPNHLTCLCPAKKRLLAWLNHININPFIYFHEVYSCMNAPSKDFPGQVKLDYSSKSHQNRRQHIWIHFSGSHSGLLSAPCCIRVHFYCDRCLNRQHNNRKCWHLTKTVLKSWLKHWNKTTEH